MSDWLDRARRLAADPAIAALAGLVVLALALRVVTMGWGLPLDDTTGYYHPDEPKIITGAVGFPGDIRSRTDLRYPTAYHYSLGLLALPLRQALPRLAPDIDPFLAVALLARAVTLALAVLTVVATFVLGRRLFGRPAGLVAAALVAVAPVHVIHSGWSTLDVPSAFVAVVALLACEALAAAPTRRRIVTAAVMSGLLIGTKYPGGVIVLPGMLAVIAGHRRAGTVGGRRQAAQVLAAVGLYMALTAATALITTPTILLRPERLTDAVLYETDRQGLARLDWLEPEAWLDAADALATAVSPAVAALFLLGAGAAIWRVCVASLGRARLAGSPRDLARRHIGAWPVWPEILLLAFLAPYYLVLGDRAANRYLVIVVPVLALLAGRLVAWLDARLPHGRPVLALVVVAVWAAGLAASVEAVRLRRRPDVRTEAARFLTAHAPDGATVCLDKASGEALASWKRPRVPDRLAVVDCLEHPHYVLAVDGGLGRIEEALASPMVSAGFTWEPAHDDWWPSGRPPLPEKLRFYDELLHGGYEQVARFETVKHPAIPFEVSGVRIFRRLTPGP